MIIVFSEVEALSSGEGPRPLAVERGRAEGAEEAETAASQGIRRPAKRQWAKERAFRVNGNKN